MLYYQHRLVSDRLGGPSVITAAQSWINSARCEREASRAPAAAEFFARVPKLPDGLQFKSQRPSQLSKRPVDPYSGSLCIDAGSSNTGSTCPTGQLDEQRRRA